MITKTTNLDSAYTDLFDEIRSASNGDIDISNIEGFFGNIEGIAQLDKKFLRLPLDEPLFEINANTRAISVPAEFRSNGLSVQGDHLAETVFFSIDRYFDYTDLSTTDITINWKMGQNTGRTKNFIMNTEILPGHIVFGWPINNVITAKSGSLTFAVEFRKEQNGEIAYNFNTLAANINIKDGLVVDSSIEAVSLDNDILSILTNSAFGSGDAAVGAVNWVTGNGLVKNISEINGEFVPAEAVDSIDLETVITAGVPSSVPVDLFAEGFVDSATVLRYTNDLGENIPVFLKVPDFEEGAELPANHRYYVLEEGSNPAAYNLASTEDIAAWSAEDENDRKDLYLQLAKLTIDASGTYIARAQGEKYSNGTKIGAGEVATTDVITVPAAEVPSKINIVPSVLETSEEENDFSFADDIGNVVFIDVDNGSSLTASAELSSFGALQFNWQKKVGNASSFSAVSEDAVAFKNENSDTLAIAEEGKYKVSVVNFKNGANAEPVESEEWIASLPASKIIFAACSHNGVPVTRNIDFHSQGSMSQRSVTLAITNVTREEDPRGDLAYEWRKVVGENSTVVGTNANIVISAEGTYRPIVKNIYNGSIFTKTLPDVFVNDLDNE